MAMRGVLERILLAARDPHLLPSSEGTGLGFSGEVPRMLANGAPTVLDCREMARTDHVYDICWYQYALRQGRHVNILLK